MKKITSIILLILSVLVFASCDISAQLESISNQIYDIVSSVGDDYLKETTSTSTKEEKPVSSSSSSSSSSSQDTSTDEEPDEPPAVVIPTRNPATFDQMMGMNVTFDLKSDKDALATSNPFATGRKEVNDLGAGVVNEDSILGLYYARTNAKMIPVLCCNVDFSSVADASDGNARDEASIKIAEALCEYYNTYSNPEGASIRRMELGKHPDLTLQAEQYAKILNYAYDGGNGRVDTGIKNLYYYENGVTKIIAGPLSQPSMMYMYNLLDSLVVLRDGSANMLTTVTAVATDSFIPSNVTPESQYLNPNNELVKMVNLRNTTYKQIEIIISSFGYNTIDEESEYYVTEQRQADYLVRSYLLFAGLGIDSASVCQYKDADGDTYNGFGTLGKTGIPKLSQYYLYGLSRLMVGYKFVDSVENEKGAMIYRFENESGDIVYAVWNAVNDGSVISDVEISAEGKNVILAKLPTSYASGEQTRLIADENGFVKVDAGETPVFLKVTEPEPEPDAPARVVLSIDQIMGIFANFTPENSSTSVLCVNNPYAQMVIAGTHNTTTNVVDVAGGRISIVKGRYGVPSLLLDVDLSRVTEAGDGEGEKSFADIAELVKATQKTQGSTMTAGVYKLALGKTPDLSMSAGSYAKLISLAYDGNRGEIEGTGIMNAGYETKSQLYTGYLSAPNAQYMSDMFDALKLLRGRNTILALAGVNTNAFVPANVTPESYYLDKTSELYKMIALRNESYNHVEIGVRFGYNTLDTESDYYVTEQVQANYLVRSYLLLSALGVDNATICQYKDVDGEEFNGFGTLNADGTEKLSQYYLAIMSRTLEGFTFAEMVENAQGAMVYRFENEGGDSVYAVWNAVNDGSSIEDVQITVGQGDATLVTLTGAYAYDGTALEKDTTNEIVTVDAGEAPVFVKVVAPSVE